VEAKAAAVKPIAAPNNMRETLFFIAIGLSAARRGADSYIRTAQILERSDLNLGFSPSYVARRCARFLNRAASYERLPPAPIPL